MMKELSCGAMASHILQIYKEEIKNQKSAVFDKHTKPD